jgi:hypothetical protein
MPTLTIQITAPAGTEINVQPVIAEPELAPLSAGSGAEVADAASGVDAGLIREFLLNFMPLNGPQPELYRVSAQRMLSHGRWTVDDLAEDTGQPVSSVHAHVRNSGRTTHTWKQRKGMETPVEWIPAGYAPGTRRRQFAYSPGVAEAILEALGNEDD